MTAARVFVPLAVLVLSSLCVPATAFAQASSIHWSALWGGAIFLAAAVVLVGIGFGLAFPGWNRLGIALWMLVMTAGGCLSIYAMQGASTGEKWQMPAFSAGFLVFAVAGNWTLRRLKSA